MSWPIAFGNLGLFNYTAFKYMKSRWPERTDWTYIVMDVNWLKQTNDQYGHCAGDELLCCAARCIREVKAQNGALAQYTITLTREEGQAADGQTTDQPADGTDGQTTDQPSDGQTTDQSADGQTADQPSDGQTTDQPADGTDGQNAGTETAEDDDTYNMEYLQQEYNDLSEQYAKEKSFSRNMMGIMAFVIAVLVVIIVNLLLRGSKRDDWDDEEDQDDWDWESAKKVKDQEQQEDADFEENSSMEEENDIEPERRGFFHGKTKTVCSKRSVVLGT